MYKINKLKNELYNITLHAVNNQIILKGEEYSTKVGCLNAIESIRLNSQKENSFQIKESSNGKYYFYLKAKNGQIIGTSQYYELLSSIKNAIESVKKNSESNIIQE